MQILQLNLEKGWRGGERQTLLTACAQREQGHHIELVARADAELSLRARSAGFTVHHARNAVSLAGWLALNGSRFDILHAQTAGAITGAVLAKPFHRRAIVFTRRTDFPVTAGKIFTRLKWQCVDQFVAISQAAAAEPRRFGLNPRIIPSAIPPITPDTGRINAFIRQHALAGKRLIGTSAALKPEKDPFTLIQAAADVCQRNPDVVFVHWGVSGASATSARNLITALGLEKKYLLLGFQQHPEQLYSALSGFVLCSISEALGSSLLDAMSLCIPVIGTKTGGIKEVLAEQRGLLVEVGDSKQLALSIEKVLCHTPDIQDMAERAQRYVQTKHDVNIMAQSYLVIYAALCRERLPNKLL